MSDPRKDPSRRCLPVEEWPCPDREAWNNAIRAGDLLDGSGAAAHWREGTRKKVQSSYGRYLTFLKRKGALNSATGPGAAATQFRRHHPWQTFAKGRQPICLHVRWLRDQESPTHRNVPALALDRVHRPLS